MMQSAKCERSRWGIVRSRENADTAHELWRTFPRRPGPCRLIPQSRWKLPSRNAYFFLFEEIYIYINILFIQCLTSNVSLREYSCIIFHQRIINGLCVCTYDNSNVTTRGTFEYVDDKLQGFLFFSFLTLRPPFFPEKKRYCRLLFTSAAYIFMGTSN